MPPGRTKVVVFSSSTLFRQGLESMLDESPAVEIAGMTGLWETVLSQIQALHPDAVVVDRDDHVPDNFLDQLFESAAEIRVVILSLQDDRLTVYTQSSISHPRRPQLLAAVTQRFDHTSAAS